MRFPLRRYGVLLGVLTLCLPAMSCGPDFPEAIFVKQFGPDAPYKLFVAGRLGVPRSSYRVRHLAITYDVLTGRKLSAAEQVAAEKAHVTLLQDGYTGAQNSAAAPGYDAWIKARAAFGAIDGAAPLAAITTTRTVPGVSYSSFVNCLDDGFATAARTLAARATEHGAKSPEVVEWVRGQDRVFGNCGDLPGSFNNGKYTPESAPPLSLPATLTKAPPWLLQDRAYQIAAARFYATDFPAAAAAFGAVAADRGSPWSAVAAYLRARTMIRQATLTEARVEGTATTTEADREAAVRAQTEGLKQAQAALRALSTDAKPAQGLGALEHSVQGLMNWIALRVDPEAQRLVLARRLQGSEDPNFGQDLIDLTYATLHPKTGKSESGSGAASGAAIVAGTKPEGAMLAWIDAMAGADEAAALRQWRATGSTAWLLAAVSSAVPGGPDTGELIRAAEAVPATNPAWTALTYHRLRLLPPDAAMRAKLMAVLPSIEATQGRSARNLFAALNAASAPDLLGWLRTAGRLPAAQSVEGDETDLLPAGGAAAQEAGKLVDQPCGPALPDAQTPLFTPAAADGLNTRLALDTMATAAEATVLAPNLRFALAQAVWTRAVLLDRPAVARRMTPLLVGCRAAWKPVLAAYDEASMPDGRHVAGLLATMRFASTEPNVRAGEQRSEGFATYSALRDNWWDKTVSPAANVSARNFTGSSVPETTSEPSRNAGPSGKANTALAADPLRFLSSQELAAAKTDVEAMRRIPAASDYFAEQALGWWKSHPQDAANPDLLGEAMRVARNAPRTEHTPANEHALFNALHTAYPESSWAKRYTSWE